MEKKVSNMWKSFLPSIVVFALQLAFSYIGMFLVFCLQAHNYTGGGFKKFIQSYYKVVTSTDFNVLVMLVYAVIATVLFSLWYYKKVRDKEKDQPAFAAFQKQPFYFIAGALLLAFGMQYLCTYLSLYLRKTGYEFLGSECCAGVFIRSYAYESFAGCIYIPVWSCAWLFCGKSRKSVDWHLLAYLL